MSNESPFNSYESLHGDALDPSSIGPTLPPVPPITFPTGPTGNTGPTGPPAPPLVCDVAGSIGECSFEGSPVENGDCSFAEGCGTTANGDCSHAEGCGTEANGACSHAEGCCSTANGDCSHAEGSQTVANGTFSHSEGALTQANGDASHAEGEGNIASGRASHVEGGGVDLLGNFAPNLASGSSAHAEGVGTIASGFASHAEGGTFEITNFPGPQALGDFSHAEGQSTTASGTNSHSEGFFTTASGFASHAEGSLTIASGFASHAEGSLTIADGSLSHTEGFQTCANGLNGVHVMGQNGGPNPAVDPPFSWYLVNGAAQCDITGVVAKILNDGSACFDSTVTASAYITSAGACDYAEMFETIDGQPIDVGYFVTLDGEKIRKANANDDYIVGVTSSRPGILADTQDPTCSKYLLDEWNREIYEEVVKEAIKDRKGNVIVPEHVEIRKKVNPNWNPDIPCSSRLTRPEWVAVGLVGKLLVRDDGTCQINSYCKSNDEGIATASTNGYRVMKRTGPNQILILFR
ncbi:peptidase G2 autoproteolytic cleavage domain-containing protein [Bacillus wiedmannii]|uniref:peptidase G2 autoproteolytic cleavage domain-containing protein n=1 Tax=Bacillus wiedmannii TaxID=1890302 RepID=UPI003CEB59B3